MKHGYEPSNLSRGVENLLTMPSNPQCLLFGKRWTPFQFTLVVFIFLVLFNEYFIYVFQTMRWPNVPDINRYVLIHVLSFYFFVFIIVTIGPLWPHALDILFWEVDRLCLHPQAMSVYYQKGITCLTAQLEEIREALVKFKSLFGPSCVVSYVVFPPIYLHLVMLVLWLNVWTDMSESLKSSTECKMNLVSEHLTFQGL